MAIEPRGALRAAEVAGEALALDTVSPAYARSWLLSSGLDRAGFESARLSPADQLILDIEDAVDDALKAEARDAVAGWLDEGGEAWVRVNDAASPFWADDLAALAQTPGLTGIVLAKVEAADDVRRTVERVPAGVPVVALIESAAGIEQAVAIASVPGVSRLAFGSGDYRRDTGAGNDNLAMAYPRSRLVVASRIGGLPGPIDGPTVTSSPATLREQTAHSVALGMTGKLCLDRDHPVVVNEVMSPSPADLRWAIDFIADYEHATLRSRDGSIKPRLARARLICERAAQFGIRAA